MNWAKRLGFLLAALLLLTAAALADDSWITSGDYQYRRLDNGKIAIMNYTGEGGAVTVPAALDGLPVEAIGESAFQGCFSLTSVTLPEGITRVEDNAFFACDALTSVTLPRSLTTLAGNPFYGCDALTSVELPAGLAAPERNPFLNCSALTRITVAEGSAALEVRQGMLYSRGDDTLVCCPQGLAVGALTVPEGTRAIGPEAFMGSAELTSLTLPEGVTTVGDWAFRYCGSLTSVSLPGTLTLLGEAAFDGCSDLAALTLPEGLTELPSLCLRDCGSLTRLELPEGMQSIGNFALQSCRRLEEIVLPASLREVASFAFYECDGLARVRFLGDEAGWAAVTVGVFNDPLTDAELSFGPAPQTAETDVDLPEDLTVIESGAFADLAAGTGVRFHDGVTEIAPDAFPAGVIFIAPAGSFAAQWGAAHGYTVVEPEE